MWAARTTFRAASDAQERDFSRADDEDQLCEEEPLSLRIGRFPLAVLMRTPGQDQDLALGFLLTEGIIASHGEVLSMRYCASIEPSPEGDPGAGVEDEDDPKNVLIITLAQENHWDPMQHQRAFFSSSSCGVCGKRSIAQALRTAAPLEAPARFSLRHLASAPDLLRPRQELFARTGAVHAAALFRAEGVLLSREDIGRHNATDKVIGGALRARLDMSSCALLISGRASFEIVQKALAARISCVVAVGGVSSLALQLARSSGISLVGFATKRRLCVYHGQENLR